ncbi:MAG: ester cyclase [bacterium]|nr:ester cyclase [bacterium]
MNQTVSHAASAYQFTPLDQAHNIANKRRLMAIMDALTSAPFNQLEDIVRDGYHADAHVHVTHPVNTLTSHAAIAAAFWSPLRQAIPDAERHHHVVAGGHYRDADWVGCFGQIVGTFARDWLGIPASNGVVSVRFAEGHALRANKIVISYLFVDFLDLMRQAGYWPIAPSLGREMPWLPPATLDGVILTPQDVQRSQRSIERVLAMHDALGLYNGQPPTRAVLDLMHMVDHWHPNFMWYGPAGIGTTRGLRGFEDFHQIPFLVAFPDRRGDPSIGHFIRIGDGDYAVTGGWGSLQATHTGGNFLGMPPTGRRIQMRVMDFYRCDEQTIVENWIPMDIPHMLLQMGVDVFGRMRRQGRQHQAISVGEWLVS